MAWTKPSFRICEMRKNPKLDCSVRFLEPCRCKAELCLGPFRHAQQVELASSAPKDASGLAAAVELPILPGKFSCIPEP